MSVCDWSGRDIIGQLAKENICVAGKGEKEVESV
jgi:hypothetical protein